MKKLILGITFAFLILGVSSSLQAQTVYVTKGGDKYHKQNCQFAKNATAMSRADAEKKGLKPCSVCFGESTSQNVYVTKSGDKYHKKDCQYAKGATAMSRIDAEKKGLKPCTLCFGANKTIDNKNKNKNKTSNKGKVN
jgi:hypothetical protein